MAERNPSLVQPSRCWIAKTRDVPIKAENLLYDLYQMNKSNLATIVAAAPQDTLNKESANAAKWDDLRFVLQLVGAQ
jgi:hypothetical protein